MNDPGSKKILRGIKVEETVFCGPGAQPQSGKQPEEIAHPAENNLGSLTANSKGKHSEETRRQGEKSGYKKGLQDGQTQGYEAGRSEGLELGFKQGLITARGQFKDSISMLNLIAAAFQIKKEEIFEQVKPDIVKLCLILCEKLLQKELKDPLAFASLIDKLLQQVKSIIKDVPVDVVVAPEDLEMLKNNMEAIGETGEALKQIHFIAETTMERGNCRLETSLGMLNFNIQRVLKDLEVKVLEA